MRRVVSAQRFPISLEENESRYWETLRRTTGASWDNGIPIASRVTPPAEKSPRNAATDHDRLSGLVEVQAPTRGAPAAQACDGRNGGTGPRRHARPVPDGVRSNNHAGNGRHGRKRSALFRRTGRGRRRSVALALFVVIPALYLADRYAGPMQPDESQSTNNLTVQILRHRHPRRVLVASLVGFGSARRLARSTPLRAFRPSLRATPGTTASRRSALRKER